MSIGESTDFFGAPPPSPAAPEAGGSRPPARNEPFGSPMVRDRIVVLGRRKAGKTIYLARLYESAWNGRVAGLHMRAIPGPGNGHERFMSVVDSMSRGHWPEATVGSTTTPIDVEYRGERTLMIALDYPGEVFRRAFVLGSEEESARELREHVDRAAGVILLLDPDVAITGDMTEKVDDDYGMSEAIRRIREQPGGESVPVAIVLTKCDKHGDLIKEAGGLRGFTDRYYHNILRACRGRHRRFSAAAVRVRRDARGHEVPTLKHPPINILEPMAYCIERVMTGRRQERENMAAVAASRRHQEALRLAAEEEAESSRRVAIGVGIAIGVLVIAFVVNYVVFIGK